MGNGSVSIIVPTRNSASTIGACLESLRRQTYRDIEIIVVDNEHTTDATRAIASTYTTHVVAWGPERNSQRNYGAARAKGAYYLFIDSDMTLDATVVASCVATIQQPGTVSVVIPEQSFGEGFWAQCKRLERSFYVGVRWIEAARFMTASAFRQIGGYDEGLISGEDWNLSQKLERVGSIGRVAPYILHNEGAPTLIRMLKKKYYYARHILKYFKSETDAKALSQQRNVIKRFALFFRAPGRLFRNPVLGLGMLFMKSAEFVVGGIAALDVRFRR